MGGLEISEVEFMPASRLSEPAYQSMGLHLALN